jgi:hypothetical protein
MAIKIPQKQSSGGGGIGGIIGAGLGALAAPFTGGASLAAALPMVGAGASIGSMVGSVAAPPKNAAPSALGSNIAGSTDAISRALEKQKHDPVDQIRDGIASLGAMPPGQERTTAFQTLHQAANKLFTGGVPGASQPMSGEEMQ